MQVPFQYVDPEEPWRVRYFENCTAKPLLKQVVKDGKIIAPKKDLQEIADYVEEQLVQEIWEEEQRFENPHKHYVDMSPKYYEMKMNLLKEAQQ